jgi:hypothetical protein
LKQVMKRETCTPGYSLRFLRTLMGANQERVLSCSLVLMLVMCVLAYLQSIAVLDWMVAK